MLGLTEEQEVVVRASRSHNVALLIMEFVQRPRGATVEELLDHLDVRAGTFHPRLYELLRTRCIEVIGQRKTRTGHRAKVYRACDGAPFLQYLELRSIAFRKNAARSDLTDVERALLNASTKLLENWRDAKRRETALLVFVRRITDIAKLNKITGESPWHDAKTTRSQSTRTPSAKKRYCLLTRG